MRFCGEKIMQKKFFIFFFFLFLFICSEVKALPFGALLYKTGEGGKMYGLNEFRFTPFVTNKHLGGVGIYLGKMDGEPTVAEVTYGRVVVIPAKYFIDLDKGEEFVGAKILKSHQLTRKEKSDLLKHFLAQEGEKEDYPLKEQKGPTNGEWTSVGLAEKIYESLNNSLLAYHQKPAPLAPFSYTLNITQDGYDDIGVINNAGDCFSETKEYSKIHRFGEGDFLERFFFKQAKDFLGKVLKKDIGSFVYLNFFGKKKGGNLYVFFPYTQYLQPTLEEVKIDLPIASHGKKFLPQLLKEEKIKQEALWDITTRVLADLGVEVIKEGIAKKLHLDGIIAFFNDIKEKFSLAVSGLQYLGAKTDLLPGVAIIPEKITEKIKEGKEAVSGSLQKITEVAEDLEARIKVSQELAEREEKGLFSGPQREEILKEFEEKFDLEEEKNIEKIEEEKIADEEKPVVKKKVETKKEKARKEEKKEEKLPDLAINPSDLVINEIYPYPKEDEVEWIELYNKTGKAIKLDGFTLEDNTGPEFGSGRLTYLKGLSIAPKGFLLLLKGDDFNFSLNNKGDVLILKYKQKLIDKVAYGNFDDGQVLNNAPVPAKGEALARFYDGRDTDYDLKDFVLTSTPTPGKPNKISTPARLLLKEETGGSEPIVSSDQDSSSNQNSNLSNQDTSNNQNQIPQSTTIYHIYQPAPQPQVQPAPQTQPSYYSYQYLDVVINEIAWMGTSEATDEWLELYNNTDQPIDSTGFILESQDRGLKINLSGVLPAKGFWLLERTDDSTIVDLKADQIYTGSLSDAGEVLELRDGNRNLIDFVDCSSGWFAGSKEKRASMERINSRAGGQAANWQTSSGKAIIAYDKNSQPIFGTPKAANSLPLEDKDIIFSINILTSGIYNPYNWQNKIEGTASAYTTTSDLLAGVKVSLKSEKLNQYWKESSSWQAEPFFHSANLGEKSGFFYHWFLNAISSLDDLDEGRYLIEAFPFSLGKEGPTSTSEFILDRTPPPTPQNLAVFYDREKDELILSWQKVEDFSGISHYQISWRIGAEQNSIMTTTTKENKFSIKNPLNEEYAFKVMAYDQAGLWSDWSQEIKFKDKMQDWPLRKVVLIDNSQNANVLIDFEVNVEIFYQSEMNEDFSDIRFTDSDGQTFLDFGWEIDDQGKELKINKEKATAVVKIPFLGAYETKKVYLYYGNPSAAAVADLRKAMTWFDHFTDANTASNYETAYFNWGTGSSRLVLNTREVDAYLIPKNLLIKNFILKISTLCDYGYHGTWDGVFVGWRYQDENNWLGQKKDRSSDGYHNLQKQKDGLRSGYKTLFQYDTQSGNPWQITTVSAYETEIKFEHTLSGSYNFIEPDLNQPGKIKISRYSQYANHFFIDYLYLRQNTKPRPSASVEW